MEYVLCLAVAILPTSAIVWGAIQGFFDPLVNDNQGILEMNENGIYELRIL
jgi:hypothetical protein